ncbi:MAG: winged helix-turn-helix transcriptional regulator [Ruminococcaceae bacterium]|nr:winged helix-turn-helix transcriptional regulator [Oscillospiraceae bacterium]
MQSTRICITSKNKELSRFFELELKNMDFDVFVYDDADAFDAFDAVIVDVDTVRGTPKCTCPVIRVSADSSNESAVLTWPMPVKLIRENIYSILNANTNAFENDNDAWDGRVYVTGDRTFLINGTRVGLSKNEAEILVSLCRARGETVLRESIMELLGASEGNISDVYICLLRKKLETKFNRRLIFTHRNKGYSTGLWIDE